MTEGSPTRERRVRGVAVTADLLLYPLAVVSYIVIGYFTKAIVAFTWGPLYFIGVIEVLPRVYRRLRSLLGS